MTEQSRKEFEEWAIKEGYNTACFKPAGNDYPSRMENSWGSWQASQVYKSRYLEIAAICSTQKLELTKLGIEEGSYKS